MKSKYYLKFCPYCGANVNVHNLHPFFGGIECQKCKAITQFPMDLSTEEVVERYNTRTRSSETVPVLMQLAVPSFIAVFFVISMFFLNTWMFNGIGEMIASR